MVTSKTERKTSKKAPKSTTGKRSPGRPRKIRGDIATQWQPGISGNPAGRPRKATPLTKALGDLLLKQLTVTLPSGKVITGTCAEVLAQRMVEVAVESGSESMFKLILDRLDGKLGDGKLPGDKPAASKIVEHSYKDTYDNDVTPATSAAAAVEGREQPLEPGEADNKYTPENNFGKKTGKIEGEGEGEEEENIEEIDEKEANEVDKIEGYKIPADGNKVNKPTVRRSVSY
jgi:hypothetical protein